MIKIFDPLIRELNLTFWQFWGLFRLEALYLLLLFPCDYQTSSQIEIITKSFSAYGLLIFCCQYGSILSQKKQKRQKEKTLKLLLGWQVVLNLCSSFRSPLLLDGSLIGKNLRKWKGGHCCIRTRRGSFSWRPTWDNRLLIWKRKSAEMSNKTSSWCT